MDPEERFDMDQEYKKPEYQAFETPTRYASVGPAWAKWMICKRCGWEYWDCTCPCDEDGKLIEKENPAL